MTKREAIRRIEDHIRIHNIGEYPHIYLKEALDMAIVALQASGSGIHKKKRKYYRKCGICGERYEQSDMVRTNQSSNGWLCLDCHNIEHPEYEDFGEY